ncbi:MAG TPA: hypothetical protein VEV13_06595 [Candidatus Limnocylindria bacterium]|nr:hypothetical protein [Candidatus Limnocylindria bacterium]
MLMRRWVGLVIVVPAVLLVSQALPADAAPAIPSQVAAAWTFDSVGTASAASDASGHGRDLTLSGSWSPSPGSAGTDAARFGARSFGSNGDLSLAPGPADVAVTVLMRSLVNRPTADSPNVVQMGLYSDPGQLKLQISKNGTGRAECRFKGTAGNLLLAGPAIDVTDGGWHAVTCWRQGGTVGVSVDGVSSTRARAVGSIGSIRPLTVAARGLAPTDASDQFVGDLDVVVWAVGADARAAAESYATSLAKP